MGEKLQWRKNVLTLFACGYVAILVIFGVSFLANGETIGAAFELVKTSLTVLISGSIAVAKDLVD